LKGFTEEKILQKLTHIFVYDNPIKAMHHSHAVAILTEWDEFKTYDWQTIYKNMYKPAFLFDGRNILDTNISESIGFQIKSIGKG